MEHARFINDRVQFVLTLCSRYDSMLGNLGFFFARYFGPFGGFVLHTVSLLHTLMAHLVL